MPLWQAKRMEYRDVEVLVEVTADTDEEARVKFFDNQDVRIVAENVQTVDRGTIWDFRHRGGV